MRKDIFLGKRFAGYIDFEKNCNLVLGDCLNVLKEVPDETFDLVLTDPPYALVSIQKRFGKEESKDNDKGKDGSFGRVHGGFMGKQWDSEFPKVEIWKEILRTMKAGAFCVFTMSPRQDCLLNCLQTLKEAGFNLGFSSFFFLYHSGFPKASDISKNLLKKGLKEESEKWFGWKSCSLKPAVEVVIVVQKFRSEKTIVEQVLKNGCGAVNIESCRIPPSEIDKNQDRTMIQSSDGFEKGWGMKPQGEVQVLDLNRGRFPANLFVSGNPLKGEDTTSPSGLVNRKQRSAGWNMNTCGFNSLENHTAGCGDSGSPNRFYDLDRWAEKRGLTLAETLEGDLSAFFDVPKPATSEKEEGLEEFEGKIKPIATTNNRKCKICGRQQISGNPCRCPKPDWEIIARNRETTVKNFHPTTKPILLFSYLAELFCQPKGIILDPFMGSGTSGIACMKMGKGFVGIERELEYFKIAKERLKQYTEQQSLF